MQVDRAKLAMRRTVTTAVIAGGSAIVLLFGACAAALALVRGVCGAFTALAGGRAWVGELAGGALALLLFAVVVALVLHITNRRELARLEAKYGRKQPRNEVDAAAQSNDPRRAAHDR
ncbi:MAG: hypothetical protein IPJ77_21585 [Planctomycetes bacterium]|nr:hypothetical protein [Planctomycetota bacterium]